MIRNIGILGNGVFCLVVMAMMAGCSRCSSNNGQEIVAPPPAPPINQPIIPPIAPPVDPVTSGNELSTSAPSGTAEMGVPPNVAPGAAAPSHPGAGMPPPSANPPSSK